MSAIRRQYRIENDLEGGSTFAILLEAAGYRVATTFTGNVVFICVEVSDPEIDLEQLSASTMIRQLRERLGDPVEEVEIAELYSELYVA